MTCCGLETSIYMVRTSYFIMGTGICGGNESKCRGNELLCRENGLLYTENESLCRWKVIMSWKLVALYWERVTSTVPWERVTMSRKRLLYDGNELTISWEWLSMSWEVYYVVGMSYRACGNKFLCRRNKVTVWRELAYCAVVKRNQLVKMRYHMLRERFVNLKLWPGNKCVRLKVTLAYATTRSTCVNAKWFSCCIYQIIMCSIQLKHICTVRLLVWFFSLQIGYNCIAYARKQLAPRAIDWLEQSCGKHIIYNSIKGEMMSLMHTGKNTVSGKIKSTLTTEIIPREHPISRIESRAAIVDMFYR